MASTNVITADEIWAEAIWAMGCLARSLGKWASTTDLGRLLAAYELGHLNRLRIDLCAEVDDWCAFAFTEPAAAEIDRRVAANARPVVLALVLDRMIRTGEVAKEMCQQFPVIVGAPADLTARNLVVHQMAMGCKGAEKHAS